MAERRWYDRLLSLGLVVLLVALGALSFDRARRGRYDFHHFYLDARYVWEHGELNPSVVPPQDLTDRDRQLPFYLPAAAVLVSPVTALGRVPAAAVWVAGQLVAMGYSLWVLRRWGRHNGPTAPAVAAFGVAVLLAVPAFVEASRFNQVSYFVLALMLGGASALDRGRPRTAGALLGVAAVLKILPGLFLLWLLVKRRWSAATAFVAVTIAIAVLPPLVVFGPRQTVAYHRQWWEYNVRGESARGLLNSDLPEHFIDRRNQSIAQVLARLTWPEHPYAAPLQPVRLDRHTCAWLAYGITGLLLAGLLWVTRRPWRRISVVRRHAEAAVYAIGMLVFSPLLRQYYLVWAVPALVLLGRAAAAEGVPRVRRLGRVGLGVWAVGMLAWIWPLARMLGAHLIMLITIGVLLLWATHTNHESGVRLHGRHGRATHGADRKGTSGVAKLCQP